MATWDYVIVGGGSAGCVLANRLSADGTRRVLLLEAGGGDRSPLLQVPGLIIKGLAKPGLLWNLPGEADPSRGGQATPWMAGRVLGGSSSVNGMVWVRGHRADYDRWAANGCTGWDYEHVLPYFKRAERWEDGADEYRGAGGRQRVAWEPCQHPLTEAFIRGAEELGHGRNDDYNGARQEGVSHSQVNQRRGFRHSSARAYLGGLRRRRNLDVVTGATVRRVVFDGTRAVGVEYERGGRITSATAGNEVVLSAGALASPKLLLLSGVGAADHLRAHGIDVVADVHGVGRNLQEHPVLLMLWNVNVPTLNMELNPKGVLRAGLDFVLRGKGAAASPILHGLVFDRLDPDREETEIEAGFAPLGVVGANAGEDIGLPITTPGEHDVSAMELLRRPTVSVFVALLHPRSRGSVTLRSADPEDSPAIGLPFLGDERDVRDLTAGCRMVRSIFESQAMRGYVEHEFLPGNGVKTDDEWADFLRMATWGASHPIGTCRMGTDPDAVVDPELRVRGVQGLRVVDASVMPDEPSGNTNAPTIMIAEKASDLILGLS